MHRGDFEQLLPKMPDTISDRMEAVIEKCITTDGNIKSKAHGRRIAPVAVACAVILLAGGTVYAAGHLAKRLMTEKEGDHGVLVSVVTEDSSEKETEESAAEEYKSFEMAFGTKPDGMDEYKNAEGKLSDPSDNDRYFTPLLVHIDHGQEASFDKLELGHVSEERDVTVAGISGKRVVFTDGRVWYYMLYEDKNAVLVAMTGSNLSEPDFETIIGGLDIRVTEQALAPEEAYKWSDYVADWGSYNVGTESYAKNPLPSYPKKDLDNMLQIGESGEAGTEMHLPGLEVKLADVKVCDDLSLLDEEMMESEWKDSAGEDGKLRENTIYAYKAGDGIHTEDELIDEVKVRQKLVYATLEYTNNTENDMQDVWFYASLSFLSENGDEYKICDVFDEYFRFAGLPDYAYAKYEYSAKDHGEMFYHDFADSAPNVKNYISEIPAGETRTVHVAYLVNEDTLPYLVMTVNNSDSGRVRADAVWYDLRNLPEASNKWHP